MSKLLLLCEYAALNGAERSLLAVLPYLQHRRFELLVACPPQGPLAAALEQLGMVPLPLFCATPAGVKLSQSELREQLAGMLRHVRPDLVHANSLSMSRLAGPVTAEQGTRGLGHLRDILRLSRRAVGDLNRNDRLLAVSAATRDWHVQQGVSAERTHVLLNGVDLQQFRPRAGDGRLLEQLQLPSSARLIGCIGQLGMRKGTDVLLRAFPAIRSAAPDAHLLLIGERHSKKHEAVQYERQLKAASDREDIRGHVHFLGSRDDVPRLLNQLAMLVHPARQEPLGRVLLEAAASGLPVVATDVGGTREIFPAGSQSAQLVPPDDPAQLAQAVIQLLADSARRDRLGLAARRRAEQAFDVEHSARKLVRHYQELLGATFP